MAKEEKKVLAASKDYEGKLLSIRQGQTMDRLIFVPGRPLRFEEIKHAMLNDFLKAQRETKELNDFIALTTFAPHAQQAQQQALAELKRKQEEVADKEFDYDQFVRDVYDSEDYDEIYDSLELTPASQVNKLSSLVHRKRKRKPVKRTRKKQRRKVRKRTRKKKTGRRK